MRKILTDKAIEKITKIITNDPNNLGGTITIPKKITYLPLCALNGIKNKTTLIIPSHVKLYEGTLYDANFKNIVIECNNSKNKFFSFRYMPKLKTITFKKHVDLNPNTFLETFVLENIQFEGGVGRIPNNTFIDRLEHLSFPTSNCKIEEYTNFCNKFRYLYIDKKTKSYVFCKDLPKEQENITNLIDLKVFNLAFGHNFLVSNFMKSEKQLQGIYQIAKYLIKKDVCINDQLLLKLIQYGKLNKFLTTSNFIFYKKEVSKVHKKFATISNTKGLCYETPNGYALISFAAALGCFSYDHIKDKNGKDLPAYLAQKACSFFSALISAYGEDVLPINTLVVFEKGMLDLTPSQAFLEYVSVQDDNKEFPLFKQITSFDSVHNGFLYFFMNNFDKILQNRTIIINGKLKQLSIFDAGVYHFSSLQYTSIPKDSEDLAKLFMTKGVSEKGFKESLEIIKKANSLTIPEHLLGKALDEKNLIDKIDDVKLSINDEIDRAKKSLIKAYATNFTFEMLSKKDDRNLIIGTYASCCATIDSPFYGKDIAIKTMLADDVQNMVIKDAGGNIIAKTTIYLNTRDRYAVLNDFEINAKYKKHATYDFEYSVPDDSVEEIEREAIFYAFMRGIHAFVKEYDKNNPRYPLLRVSVGMGCNRLRKQTERYLKAQKKLKVPHSYCFEDAADLQHTLYYRGVETLLE